MRIDFSIANLDTDLHIKHSDIKRNECWIINKKWFAFVTNFMKMEIHNFPLTCPLFSLAPAPTQSIHLHLNDKCSYLLSAVNCDFFFIMLWAIEMHFSSLSWYCVVHLKLSFSLKLLTICHFTFLIFTHFYPFKYSRFRVPGSGERIKKKIWTFFCIFLSGRSFNFHFASCGCLCCSS